MKRVSTAIDIAAPPARVWALLVDFPAHAAWNPFIRSISGVPKAGERLRIHVVPPGGKGMRFRPKVLAAEPERELRWLGRLFLPGLFDGEHLFRLEPIEGGTRLHHEEAFSGLLVAAMGSKAFEAIAAGFEAMNTALKEKAEGGA